jgi:hypothetical protein
VVQGPGCDGFCLMLFSPNSIGRSPRLESPTHSVKVKRPFPRRTAQEELLWLDIPALVTPLTPSHANRFVSFVTTTASISGEMGVQTFCTIYAYFVEYLLAYLAVAYTCHARCSLSR